VNPESETDKKGTVLMGGTVSYEEIAIIQPGVQGFGGMSVGEWRKGFGSFARAAGWP
jgi:hypothetical protein